ncbi:MAG: M15 family metallopeptidase [Bacteriovorax sp.]
MVDLKMLTGQSMDHLVPLEGHPFLVHFEMKKSLEALIDAARKDGFELALTSSFRSYETQKKIWNDKVEGKRAVLDSASLPVDISTKTREEILFLILRWSAIPGGSRHHWGTDIDVFDQKAKPSDYKVQLVPSEYEEGGMFYELTLWLNEHMEHFGFSRPYWKDIGGIAPEPWHLSYLPLSEKFLEKFTFLEFSRHLMQSDFLLIEEARLHKELLYERFIQIPR